MAARKKTTSKAKAKPKSAKAVSPAQPENETQNQNLVTGPAHVGVIQRENPQFLKNPKVWGSVVAVLALALAAWLIFITVQKPAPLPETAIPQSAYDRYSYAEMNADDVRKQVQQQFGIDITQLQDEGITKASFKDFNQAYAVAQAFSGIEDFKNSAKAFAIAESMAPKDVSYQFYLDYANLTDNLENQTSLTLRLLKKAQPLLKAAKGDHADELSDLANRISGLESSDNGGSNE